MRPQRLPDLFARLFDQREPLLFLVGATLLAVLGNAGYALLLDIFGDTWVTHLWVVLVSLVFGVSFTRKFWLLFKRRNIDSPNVVPVERQAEAHAGLILLVGPSERAAERAIIQWHLRNNTLKHCWMVVDPDVERSQKFRDLGFWLLEQNVRPHTLLVQDGSQANLSYKAVKKGIASARDKALAQPFIVDITGGFKPMTAGAVLACRDEGVSMQYMVSKRDPITGDPDRTISIPMKVEFQAAGQQVNL